MVLACADPGPEFREAEAGLKQREARDDLLIPPELGTISSRTRIDEVVVSVVDDM